MRETGMRRSIARQLPGAQSLCRGLHNNINSSIVMLDETGAVCAKVTGYGSIKGARSKVGIAGGVEIKVMNEVVSSRYYY